MGLMVCLLHRVRPHTAFVHRQRHQRNTQPGGDALDEGVGQGLDAAAAARRNDRGEGGGNALPSVAGEDELFRGGGPCALRQVRGGNASDRRCSDAGRLSQCGIERRRFLQAIQAFCDERGLVGQHRIIEFEVDPDVARLTGRRHAAPGIARDERAPADFADDKAAAQQLGVDAARRRDSDLALVGKIALGRQAVARPERAVGYLRGNGVGQLQIFGLRHYCTESNVAIAPRFISEHSAYIKQIVPGTAKILRSMIRRPARRALPPTASHCLRATMGDQKCLQPFQPSAGLRSRSGQAHSLGFSAPAGMGSRAISSVAPPLPTFASSTIAHCGTSVSHGARSKRRSAVS